MGRRKKKKIDIDLGIGQEAKYGIFAIAFFALAVLFGLAAFSLAGVAGDTAFAFLTRLVGVGYYLLPILSILLGIALLKMIDTASFGLGKLIGSILFFASGLGMIELIAQGRGGLVGNWIASPTVGLLAPYGAGVLLSALIVISLIILLELKLSLDRLAFWRREGDIYDTADEIEDDIVVEPALTDYGDGEETASDTEQESASAKEPPKDQDLAVVPFKTALLGSEYEPPPLKLLERDRGKPAAGDVKGNANIIKRTLANFGIIVEIEEVTVGPTVTRYAFKPAEGVRLSRILSLHNNLELALAAHPIRIEAPIPGRSLVGIEVPNSAKTTVGLAALLGTQSFKESPAPLLFAIGRDVTGNANFGNIAKLPHILIAGATGSGKSVTIHSLVVSLLYRNSPELMRFIMVDPKRVELTLYNGIPHLLTPVITDPKKAILALKWLTNEMERRYTLLEKHGVRDIHSYHANVLGPALKAAKKTQDAAVALEEKGIEALPYIVVIVDELADIMSSYPRELEAAIVRLAQMSRAIGIHLVLSTQRPSVNVITGLIKANVPARIALQVASQVDSRTILDMSGAEKLIGSGDMLFLSADMAKPVRLQGVFISENEVKNVAAYLKKNYQSQEEDGLTFSEGQRGGGHDLFDETQDGDDDDLYEDARQTVLEAGKASTSYLQRKLRIGYARAARLMDMLEERGVIGPADGSKPRDVIDAPTRDDEN